MGAKERNKHIELMIEKAKKIVFLTGAGVSVHSGIPDYRGVGGIYEKNPMEILSRGYFNEHPFEVAQFILEKLQIGTSEPNLVHKWIASIGDKATVITQNIDGLHEKAGSKTIAFHGTANEWKCLSCGHMYDAESAIKKDSICSCGGVLEPQIIFYDDTISNEVIGASIKAIEEADLVIIIGTSMKVHPFASLFWDVRPEAVTLQINKEVIDIGTMFKATCDCMEVAEALYK